MNNILSEVIGHSEVIQRLVGLVASSKLPNTIILSGTGSIGKYKSALGLSQNIFCKNKSETSACGLCGSCVRAKNQQHEGLLVLKSKDSLIKVDQARDVTHFLSQRNNIDEYKVVIVDGAEHMNNQSANALLKTLEEPPENCFIILVTSSLYKLLPTIRSRAQVFRFGALTNEEIKKIKQVDDWLIELSGSNLDIMEKLQDSSNQEIYMKLASSISQLSDANYNACIKQISAYTKSKPQCLVLIQALQSLFYTSYKKGLGIKLNKIDWQEPALSKLGDLNRVQLMELFNESVQFEYFQKSNFDMLLVFESLFLKLVTYFNGEAHHASMDRYSYTP